MGNSKVLSLAAWLVTAVWASSAASSPATAGPDDWDKDWTALTVADNGAWGTATSASLATAISTAIGECRARAGNQGGGCGAYTATVREAWSVANVCDGSTFIVSALSLPMARADAVRRMHDLERIWQIDVAKCRHIVTIGSDGRPAAPEMMSRVGSDVATR